MASDNKTKANDQSVSDFIKSIESPQQQKDIKTLNALLKKLIGEKPIMWGSSIVGFGKYNYEYASGRKGDWMRIGYSPRKQNITLYIMDGFEQHSSLMSQFGKYKTGKSCLYIKQLTDIDMIKLEALIKASLDHMEALYPSQ